MKRKKYGFTTDAAEEPEERIKRIKNMYRVECEQKLKKADLKAIFEVSDLNKEFENGESESSKETDKSVSSSSGSSTKPKKVTKKKKNKRKKKKVEKKLKSSMPVTSEISAENLEMSLENSGVSSENSNSLANSRTLLKNVEISPKNSKSFESLTSTYINGKGNLYLLLLLLIQNN